MENIWEIARQNQERAWQIAEELDIQGKWEAVGAEVHLVGSLKMGLLMKHRDIDFHVYTSPLQVEESFAAMAKIAVHPRIRKVTYTNLIHTPEECMEWHAWYEDEKGEEWQIDMIHIRKGSFYDGYFENMAERIMTALTPEKKALILKLKYETPEEEKIMGVEYYKAVLQDGVQDYAGLAAWRKAHPVEGIVEY